MRKVDGLEQRKDELVKQSRGILATAEKEKRALTPEEKTAHDVALRELELLNVEIRDARRQEAEDLRILEDEAVRTRHGGGGAWGPTTATRAVTPAPVFVTEEGHEVRGLLPNERLSSSLRHDLPDDVRPDELHFGKLVAGLVTGRWRDAEREKRAMGTLDQTLGGYTVPTSLSANVIDMARNQARVIQAGAITLPMPTQVVAIASLDKDPAGAWTAENQSIPFTDANFGVRRLDAKKLAALIRLSIELVEDSPNAAQVIQQALSAALALEVDRACLGYASAPGHLAPIGLKNWEGVQVLSMGTDGAPLNGHDDVSKAWQLLQSANAPDANLAAIYSARTAGDLDRLKSGDGVPLMPPPSWQSIRKLVSNQIPDTLTHGSAQNASELYLGSWREMIIGTRVDSRLEISREAAGAFEKAQVVIRLYLRMDSVIARAPFFVRVAGILPTPE